jgi:hypothetical protein
MKSQVFDCEKWACTLSRQITPKRMRAFGVNSDIHMQHIRCCTIYYLHNHTPVTATLT